MNKTVLRLVRVLRDSIETVYIAFKAAAGWSLIRFVRSTHTNVRFSEAAGGSTHINRRKKFHLGETAPPFVLVELMMLK